MASAAADAADANDDNEMSLYDYNDCDGDNSDDDFPLRC